MNARDELIAKLKDTIYRGKIKIQDSRKELDMQLITLSAYNTRRTEYDQQIAEAQQELNEMLAESDAPVAPEAEPESGSGSDQIWDVFISYQRDYEKEAREVYEKLTAAGFSVWQDVHDIRHTSRWSQDVDGALRHSKRIVLLLTPEAMKSPEVFNEWFFFYQHRKPLHCLYVKTCDIHYQLLPFQYLDWRNADKRDWTRLLGELRGTFSFPTEATVTPIVAAPSSIEPTLPTASPPSAFADLLEAVRDPKGSIAFTLEQIKALSDHVALDTAEYHLTRIATWSQPRYVLDKRFVQLTLLIDKGEQAEGTRWQSESRRFDDLRQVLAEQAEDGVEHRALVVLGAPGAGKSTLLRRLQMDSAIDSLRADDNRITFYVPLNTYRADSGPPRAWLNSEWVRQNPKLPTLDSLFRERRMLLLLDALNEMPNTGPSDYHDRVELWRQFVVSLETGNRAVFSCRSLDYSATLSSPDLRVPQVVVQPMSDDQIQGFLGAYLPTRADPVWKQLHGTPQLDIFRTPFFLKLLCEQIEATNHIPEGKAALFTGYVRGALKREISNGNRLLRPDTLLTDRDLRQLNNGAWRSSVDLPHDGALMERIAALAYTMQERGLRSDGAQIRLDYRAACDLIHHDKSKDMIRAGVALNVLDEDIALDEVLFFHQLLQEFFAARKLAERPDPELVRVEWQVGKVTPTLEATIAGLADSDPLPPLPQTGWEETTLLAVAMSANPDTYIRSLMAVNLPLAARAIASAEVKASDALKHEIQNALIARTQDMSADLRARIDAGLRLGEIGDPRFERRTGPHGDYLLPPLVTIPANTYPIGSTEYDDEKPPHTVTLDTFQIGMFPVTNAEYALFIEAGGYEAEQWWETDAAKAWRVGEGSTEGQKQTWRDNWKTFQSWSDDYIKGLVSQNRMTTEQADNYISIRDMSKEDLEEELETAFPSGKRYTQPSFWNDNIYNAPAQPVVGICWHEARAYCAWLSAQTGLICRLPTEVEFEAAARGKEGRKYVYGPDFDATRSNTFESHLRRTTPIGVFNNASPEGALDLSGNVYSWTSSEYKPYPYVIDDGREDSNRADVRRVVRGGSWYFIQLYARAAYRNSYFPDARFNLNGFRVLVVGGRPPSLSH